MDSAPILLDINNGIAKLTFNRPQQLNSIDVSMASALEEKVQDLKQDKSVKVIVISGEGRCFGAGGSLSAFKSGSESTAKEIIDPMHRAVTMLTNMDAIVIASLHGSVAGGSLSLALACDLVIAAENTTFNLAYVKVAASCDVGGSWHLPRLMGLRRAFEFALLGQTLTSKEALEIGLINRVVPNEELTKVTIDLAEQLAKGPTLAYAKLKRLFRKSFENTFEHQLALESEYFEASSKTADFAEAINSFFEKRAPQFIGR